MIELSHETRELLHDLLVEGEYASEDEVIATALRLLRECREQAMIADLRHEIAIGLDEADRGELGPFDPRATLDRVRTGAAALDPD